MKVNIGNKRRYRRRIKCAHCPKRVVDMKKHVARVHRVRLIG